jgi:hypothetical protein
MGGQIQPSSSTKQTGVCVCLWGNSRPLATSIGSCIVQSCHVPLWILYVRRSSRTYHALRYVTSEWLSVCAFVHP